MTEIVALLIIVLIIVAALQPTDERLYVAFLFASFSAIHYMVMYNVDGIAYYGSAALLDYGVIFFTMRLRVISPVIEKLQNVCIISILLNGIGWIMWMSYLPPDAYNAAFIALYAWSIIILLKKEPGDVGIDTLDSRHRDIHTDFGKSNHQRNKL